MTIDVDVLVSLAEELRMLKNFIDQQWIETKDRLPPDDGKVLTFCNGYCGLLDDESRNGGAWGIGTGWYDHEEGAWYLKTRWPVTHWMPLPPPPATAQSDGD